MVFTEYEKRRILHYHQLGYKAPTIQRLLAKENISCSRSGVGKFLARYSATGSICRRPGSGRRTKASDAVRETVEEEMRRDDEATATQLQAALAQRGHSLSLSTVLRCRKSLGWTYRGSAYCQLIREQNKVRRLQWARENVGYHFEDVIFTDECSVQMEAHRRFCCRKAGEPPRNKPR